MNAYEAVSYTHLVYKRQDIHSVATQTEMWTTQKDTASFLLIIGFFMAIP